MILAIIVCLVFWYLFDQSGWRLLRRGNVMEVEQNADTDAEKDRDVEVVGCEASGLVDEKS